MNTQMLSLLEQCLMVARDIGFQTLQTDLEAAIAAERSAKQKEQAKPQQEPVGELCENIYGRGQVFWFIKPADGAKLYTSPQPLKPLSRGELITLAAQFANFDSEDFDKILEPLTRAIEAKLGVAN